MRLIELEDITVELATDDDCFVRDIVHLILEIASDGKVMGKANLLSREWTPGTWDANEDLAFYGRVGEFTISVWMELDENDRQLLGFKEMNGRELYDAIGKQYEVLLIGQDNNPSLILKTQVLGADDRQNMQPGTGNQGSTLYDHDPVEKRLGDATIAWNGFKREGNIENLDQAILHFETVVKDIHQEDPILPKALSDLGSCLLRRYELLGRVTDINNAVARFQALVDLTPDSDPHGAGCLSNLGISLTIRFERLGNLADIEDAISRLQLGVSFIPDDHPRKPMLLTHLGDSLRVRFKRLGNLTDIDDAISRQRAAVDLTPDSDPMKPIFLTNLGSSLATRFERLGNLGDINDAISQQKAAVKLTPDNHPQKVVFLHNLGASLTNRFKRLGDLSDVDAAISHQISAVDLTPDVHPDKPGRLNNLGTSLLHRFQRAEEIDDIDNAISRQQAAISLTPDGHPNKCLYMLNLSQSFLIRFIHLRELRDAESAISFFSASATSSVGPPTIRFEAAEGWATAASLISDPSLLSAYECAIGLIPLVAWLGLPIQDRHQHLIRIGGIARDAAAAAISAEQCDKALEWLEQGRSIVWTQILRLRTPVDQLYDVSPDLAGRLLSVSRLLDRGIEPSKPSEGGVLSMEEEGRRYRALTAEWESIIQQIRTLPNFETFLKPESSSHLMRAAEHGPVVVLNVAKKRCDALAIIPDLDEVIHIPLPTITSLRVTELGDELKYILHSSGMRMRGERAALKVEWESDDEDCRHVLAELWTGLVKPVIDSLAFSPNPDVLPRIWWCATGPLAFLPIHAAGIYDFDSVDAQLSDYVISSYTPSLSALLESSHSAIDPSFKLLSVIQPSAPGVSSIPNTKEELGNICRRLTDRPHVVLEGRDGVKARVMKEMQSASWLHLACHGVQKPEQPTKSALILEDGHLTLEDIIRLKLPKAELAFLSACQTTTGDEKLSEEAVHIAGGMLLAGYRGVVATMWSIKDELAPEITDEFYGYIMRDGERPDSRKAAEALHFSVQKLRKKVGVSLIDWIPFVHLGI